MTEKLQELAARLPKKEFAAELPSAKVEEFWARGFVGLDRVTTDEEVEWLREVYDVLFSGQVPLPGDRLSMNGTRPEGEKTKAGINQLLYPELVFPALRQTVFFRNTQRIARQIFGEGRELAGWGHMVNKEPNGSEIIYWHQDEAYWDPSADQEGIACWMPLDPATRESGAMSFIPGSHKGPVLKHGYWNDDMSVTALMLKEEIDTSEAVLQPVPIGGLSIHHNRTLHVSGPNTTGNVRRAYVNAWSPPAVRRQVPHDRSWYWQKLEWMQSRKA